MTVPESFLSTPVGEHLADLVRLTLLDAEESSGLPPPGGLRFGPYRVIRRIGRGGMGTVYEAARADSRYDRRVAIKIVSFAAFGGSLARRFDAERRILAGLEHPNIGRLYDAGATPQGLPYLVMEFVEGRRIDVYSEERGLSVDERLELFDRVCEAVEYAHGQLVVHSDVKPANILVTHEGLPKLLDFGVARLLDPPLAADPGTDGPEAIEPTLTVLRAMTPEYASPEQLRGERATTSADVYALGVLLYVLLTGHHPHRFASRAPEDVERTIRERPAPLPSEAAADGHPERCARLRGDLDNVVLTAMSPEADRRYPSVGHLRADIRSHLAGFPVTARPATWRYRARKFARRHRVGLAATALVVLALAGGLAGTAWQARSAAEQAARAEMTRDYLIGLFESFDPDEAGARSITAEELLDRGSARLERDLAAQPTTQAELAGVLGRLHQRLGLYDKARPLLESALAALERAHGARHPETALATARLASLLYDLDELEEAEELARASLDARHRLFGESDTTVASSLSMLAVIRGARGSLEEAEALHAEALAIVRRSGTPEQVAAALDQLGVARLRLGEHDQARRLHEEALAVRRGLYGDRHTSVAGSLFNLSDALSAMGEYEEAERLLLECVALRRELLGDRHPHVASALSMLGSARWQAGDLEGAEEAHLEALALRRAVFGDAHVETARSLNSLGVLAYSRGDYVRAADRFAEVVEIWERELGEEHPNVLSVLNNLGAARREAGEHEAAEHVLREVLTRRRRILGDEHPDIGQSLNNLALALLRRGATDEAEGTFREALGSWRASLGDGHPTLAYALTGLGRLLLEEGRCDEGEALLREAVSVREVALDPSSSLVASARAWLGLCLRTLERPEADSLLEAALPVLEEQFGSDDDLVRRIRRALETE